MSQTIECWQENAEKPQRFPLDENGNITKLRPNRFYRVRENGEDWQNTREYESNADGVIEVKHLSVRFGRYPR